MSTEFFTKPISNITDRVTSNKHTSVAAIVIFACFVLEIWFPQYSEKLKQTRELAITYGFLLSGEKKNGKDGAPVVPPAPFPAPKP